MRTFSYSAGMASFAGKRVHCVGIKGSGMAALVELMTAAGAVVTGSDSPEQFFTDALLKGIGVTPMAGFAAAHLPRECDLVVYSAAYDPTVNPELIEAARRGLRCLEYPQALGELSAGQPSLAVAGTHGKTTVTGMAAVMMQQLQLPGQAILGSLVPALDNHATYLGGGRFLAAETCEYRRHFLHYHPRWIILTNVEADHLDYYRDEEDVRSAFSQFCEKLPPGGGLIYCVDDPGAAAVARNTAVRRPDLQVVPYGMNAGGAYRVLPEEGVPGHFTLAGLNGEFRLQVPGRHNMLNAAAVIAALQLICDDLQLAAAPDPDYVRALAAFTGTRRRCEYIGQVDDIIVLDDYGHHPTEIRVTLEGIREHYPDRRMIVDFMPHTFSRTDALWDQFIECFAAADEVWLHPVFASARERDGRDPVAVGRRFAEAVQVGSGKPVRFFATFDQAAAAAAVLSPPSLFITMGAGSNYEVGTEALAILQTRKEQL